MKKFIALNFDVKSLTKVGFFKSKATEEEIEEKVTTFFGIASIYQYAIREGMWCKYVRYANGIYDTREKVNF